MTPLDVRTLGEFIREQRQSAEVSLRQLARSAGVSNPYLSQVERGLRKPSAEILGQIAAALRISVETLYVRAGLLEARDGAAPVTEAIVEDDSLSERQRQVLLEIYAAFQKENAALREASARSAEEASTDADESATGAAGQDTADGSGEPTATPRRKARPRSAAAAQEPHGTDLSGSGARPSRRTGHERDH